MLNYEVKSLLRFTFVRQQNSSFIIMCSIFDICNNDILRINQNHRTLYFPDNQLLGLEL